MVRPAENARIVFDPMLGAEGWLILELVDDDVRLRQSSEVDFRRFLRSAAHWPQAITTVDDSTLWMYREAYFWADEGLTQAEVLRELTGRLPTS
jgi:hypothetical protein